MSKGVKVEEVTGEIGRAIAEQVGAPEMPARAGANGPEPANLPTPSGEFATVDSLGNSLLPPGASAPPPKRPDGPVRFALPDGRIMTMERPKAPVAIKVSLWLGDRTTNPGLMAQYRAIMYVSEINGNPLSPVNSEQELAKRVEILGDDGVDAAVQGYMTYWPPIVVSELPK